MLWRRGDAGRGGRDEPGDDRDGLLAVRAGGDGGERSGVAAGCGVAGVSCSPSACGPSARASLRGGGRLPRLRAAAAWDHVPHRAALRGRPATAEEEIPVLLHSRILQSIATGFGPHLSTGRPLDQLPGHSYAAVGASLAPHPSIRLTRALRMRFAPGGLERERGMTRR
jgi:hypothetical protein